MTGKFVFINRRRGEDRRFDKDPCRDIPMDLFHRKRRKSAERRDTSRNLSDDYYAFMQKTIATAKSEAEKPPGSKVSNKN